MVRRGGQRGLVLIIVLWTVAILLLLAAGTRQTSALDTKMSVFTTQELRCKWAAKAGAEKAIAILNEDDRTVDSLDDLWSDDDEDLVGIPLEGCHYTVRVLDESGKLNVNTATKEQLMGLKDWGMEPAIADAIIDWRDGDDTPGEEGAEGGYYENLAYPYVIRNGPFKTVRELLKVRGITEQLLYGEDTSLRARMDPNASEGAQASSTGSGAKAAAQGWITFLTCYASASNLDAGKVNINQASAEQLQQQLGVSSNQARWIVDNRPGNGGYRSIGDLISSSSPRTASQPSSGGGGDNNAEPMDLQTYHQIVERITVVGQQSASGPTPESGPGSSSDSASGPVSPQTSGSSGASPPSVPKVNINTAPREVLVALWGGTDLAYEIANNVLTYRDSTLLGMQGIGDLLDVSSMSIDAFKQVVDIVAVQSNVFCIYSAAEADQTGISGASGFTEVVVDRGPNPPTVLYRYQGVSQ